MLIIFILFFIARPFFVSYLIHSLFLIDTSYSINWISSTFLHSRKAQANRSPTPLQWEREQQVSLGDWIDLEIIIRLNQIGMRILIKFLIRICSQIYIRHNEVD